MFRKVADWHKVGLGTKPDTDLARELGVHRETVSAMRRRLGIPAFGTKTENIDWETVGLGEKPDYVLTQELGVHFNRVGKERRKRNIPIYINPNTIDWNNVPLGTKPDSVIAHDLQIPRERVKYHRNLRNIPAFVGVILLQEGYPCRSIYEAMYDACLHWKQIAHEHEARIEGLPYIADFKIDSRFVEIPGMLHFPKYREKYNLKRKALEENGIPVTWLQIEDIKRLYADCPVPLRFREQRECLDCGKQTHNLVKGVCRTCYMQQWHQQSLYTTICGSCGKEFSYHDNDAPKYCSKKCYWT
ncbi:hypothetical protein KSC_003990 [Ktedonobacter sp. SOSP1-52]|uniref:hypothetical protein n=1 Tax=Ktedonobacter sp. SOSP1-52 TaxID=2778366 RepID=UPI00191572B6|nr:hypothetical protein [Ktedonobacter sp. SOSP1-52]GHO61507.1 hypothetical protein KSC_003990 [Ktedonobacter sp. SOSP1-52]